MLPLVGAVGVPLTPRSLVAILQGQLSMQIAEVRGYGFQDFLAFARVDAAEVFG